MRSGPFSRSMVTRAPVGNPVGAGDGQLSPRGPGDGVTGVSSSTRMFCEYRCTARFGPSTRSARPSHASADRPIAQAGLRAPARTQDAKTRGHPRHNGHEQVDFARGVCFAGREGPKDLQLRHAEPPAELCQPLAIIYWSVVRNVRISSLSNLAGKSTHDVERCEPRMRASRRGSQGDPGVPIGIHDRVLDIRGLRPSRFRPQGPGLLAPKRTTRALVLIQSKILQTKD